MGSEFPIGRLGEAEHRPRSDAHVINHVAPFTVEGLRANAGEYNLDSSRALATIAARTQLNEREAKGRSRNKPRLRDPMYFALSLKVTCYPRASRCQELFS